MGVVLSLSKKIIQERKDKFENHIKDKYDMSVEEWKSLSKEERVKMKGIAYRTLNRERLREEWKVATSIRRKEKPYAVYESNKQYIEKNKDKVRNAYYLNRFGISLEEYNYKLEQQKGVCFVCKEMPTTKRLAVDHLHIKGFKAMSREDKKKYVRGLLCWQCNVMIGKLEKRISGNRMRLEGTVEYFSKYAMKGELD